MIRLGGMAALGAGLVTLMLPAALGAAESRSSPPPLRMTQHTIVDRQGYGGPIEALGLLVPSGWETQSDVRWAKPCSGGDLYDIRLRTRASDGRTGLQYLPALKFETLAARVTGGWDGLGVPPQEGVALFAQQQQQIAASFQGTNCHAFLPRTPREIVERIVMPSRPPDARIVEVEDLPEVAQARLAALRQIQATGGSQPGDTLVAQAGIVKIRYGGKGGMLEEAFFVAFGGFHSVTPMTPGLVVDRSFVISDPLVSFWAPQGELEPHAELFRSVLNSVRANPRWESANAQVRRNIAEINRRGAAARQKIFQQAQQEISDSQMESWRRRDASSDYIHQEFMETVNETERLEDPSGGIVEMPSHYDDYYTNGTGDYVGMPAGVDPADLYPDSVWTEMPRYQGPN